MENFIKKISVVVTCYNYGIWLERCVRSLLNQKNFYDYEIIIVDDCSSDITPSVCGKLVSLYNKQNNVKFIRLDSNCGLPIAANIGIQNCIGQYVVRVDADDYVASDFLYLLDRFLQLNKDKYQAVACDYFKVDSNENRISRFSWETEQIACGILYNKTFLYDVGLYNNDFKFREGHELNKRFSEKYNIGVLEMPIYRYRIHNNNRTIDMSEEVKKYDLKLMDGDKNE